MKVIDKAAGIFHLRQSMMHGHRFKLRSFLAGSIAVLAAVIAGWALLELTWFAHASPQVRQWISLLASIPAALIVTAWAAIVIRRLISEKERTETKFRSLLESAPDALWIMDKGGRIVLINRKAEQLFGYNRAELLGKPAESLVRKEVTAISGNHRLVDLDTTNIERRGDRPSVHGRRKDGSEFPVEITFSPMETTEGLHIVSFLRDVSERTAREGRRATRRTVRRLLADAVTLDAVAPDLLRTACEGLGWDVGILWNVSPNQDQLRRVAFWHKPDMEVSDSDAAIRVRSFAPGAGLPGQVSANGEPAWVADVAADPAFLGVPPIAGEALHGALTVPIVLGGEVLGVLDFFSRAVREPDERLTETLASIGAQIAQFIKRNHAEEALRRTEEQFRQAQKMEAVGQLAGGVAHDFNNLLTVILGYSDHLTKLLSPDDPALGPIRQIARSAERAAALTRQLLAFSRKQVLAPQVLDLNTVIIDLSTMLKRLIGEDIDLRTALAPRLHAVRVDPGQIEQVIMNLAINARDAMTNGGNLTIETALKELDGAYTRAYPDLRPGTYAMLAVSDTGCGMTAQVKVRIFEPFFTTKEVGKGTGLGLATVYGIIKQSGGHIAVYSERGQGSTFKIYLPCAEEAIVHPPASPRTVDGVSCNETVLVVEDEEQVRALTREVLEKNGYKVLEARHGQEALDLCQKRSEPVDIMVTDMVMPGMNGRQLARCLRRLQPNLKVLFVSGYTDNALLHSNRLDAHRDFLQKPFTPADLTSRVREVLRA